MRRVSKEGTIFRIIAATAIGATLLGCARPTGQRVGDPTPTPTSLPTPDEADPATPTPEPLAPLLPCREGEIYPADEEVPIPLEGRYLIKPPIGYSDFCEVRLVTDMERMIAILGVSSRAIELLVETGDVSRTQVYASTPPGEGQELNHEFRGLSIRVTVTEDGYYLVEYRFDRDAWEWV